MIARAFQAIGWSALFGFAAGAGAYIAGALMTAYSGPVLENLSLLEHAGRAVFYGFGGLIILGSALLVSYLVWQRSRPPATAIFRLAIVALAVQILEQGMVEAFAIRESNALSQSLGEQLIPFNIGTFEPVGIWEGRPDAFFFWFSPALTVFIFAAFSARRAR